MASRYELSEVQWGRIQDILPGRKGHVGRTAEDNRNFVNGVLWVHLLANELGLPLGFVVTAGQVADCTQAIALLGQRQAEAVIADKGYDADTVVQHIEATGAKAVIPPRSNRKVQRSYNPMLYQMRNRIERCFSKLKQFRRFATRYEKSRCTFHAMVALACAWIILQLYVDTA